MIKSNLNKPVGGPGVSVVICCYNSAKRLPDTLGHLKVQTGAESIPWEVLVIDNASSDATAQVARQCWPEDSPIPLRVVSEPVPGLRRARHRGLTESQFEFLAFVDDDNWVAPDWIARVFGILAKHPEVAVCGGCGVPIPELAPPPAWFPAFASAYAVGPQGKAEGYVERNRSFLYGAGVSVRKSAWTSLIAKGFRPLLTGRKGKSLTSGEDSELCYALILSGWKLWYDPNLTFKHYLPAGRLTWTYLRRLHRDFGAAVVWMEQYKQLIDPPSNVAFRSIPLTDKTSGVIRRCWLFQIYATTRTLWPRFRDARSRKGCRRVEGDVECLRTEWEMGRAICLLKSFLVYDRTFSRLKRAEWIVKKSDERKVVAATQQKCQESFRD